MNKEEEISRKIEMLKRKNEQIMQRHKEVEADKKSAEKSGQVLHNKPADLVRESTRRDERGGSGHVHPKAHMDDVQDDTYDRERRRPPQQGTSSRGRGTPYSRRGTARADTDAGHEYDDERQRPPQQSNTPRGRGRGTPRGRGRGGRRLQDYGEKRLENYRLMEEEMSQGPGENEDPPVSRFLDDPRRRGELEPDERWRSTRHKGNFGGLEFDKVRRGMGRGRGGYYNREYRGRGRGMSRMQMSAELTGRERQDQERWQAMREAADKEIQARSKNSEGKWRREWDAEKNEEHSSRRRDDSGQNDRYDEPRSTYRGGGRGRRDSGRGRRGSRSSQEAGENGKKKQAEADVNEECAKDDVQQDAGDETTASKCTEEKPEPSGTVANQAEEPKTQRPRKKQNKSPRHLVQQRAQTPSSKDGTEVWAQNSHHSDETGAEWKNGASRSVEQWLPSNEGNRNPAIDERRLEQQEDGATVYSQQLGRGWGSEKNIKATKAWVIDTEKAGATKQKQLEAQSDDSRGRNGDRNTSRRQPGRRSEKGQARDSRIKEVISERAEMRSASPRLKRENPGLTVEIHKGEGRRVKRYSEGDSSHYSNNKKETGDTVAPENQDEQLSSPTPVKSPLSAFLKTPEGVKHVEDWAMEMDLQSPTYELRQKEIQEAIALQASFRNEGGSSKKDDDTDPENVCKSVVKDLINEIIETEDKASYSNRMLSESRDKSNLSESRDLSEKEGGLASSVIAPMSPLEHVLEKNPGKPDSVTYDKPDTAFEDASEDVEDEFFECDTNEGEVTEKLNASQTAMSEKKASKVDAISSADTVQEDLLQASEPAANPSPMLEGDSSKKPSDVKEAAAENELPNPSAEPQAKVDGGDDETNLAVGADKLTISNNDHTTSDSGSRQIEAANISESVAEATE